MSGSANFAATGGGQQDYNAFLAQAMANAQQQQAQQRQQQAQEDAQQQQQQQQQQQDPSAAAMQQQQQAFMNAMAQYGGGGNAALMNAMMTGQQLQGGMVPQLQQQSEPAPAPQAAPEQQQQQQPTADQGSYAAALQQFQGYYGGMMGQMAAAPLAAYGTMMGGTPATGQQQQQMDPNANNTQLQQPQMDPNAMDPNSILALQQLLAAQQQQQQGVAMNPWMSMYNQDYQAQQQALLASSLSQNAGLSRMEVPSIKLKQVPKKKPKGKPKRPLSAYNIFFKEERERILQTLPKKGEDVDSKEEEEAGDDGTNGKKRKRASPHGKIGFENLAKTIGKRWRELDPDDLTYYKVKAGVDMKRYKDETEKFMAKQREASERKMESINMQADGDNAKKVADDGEADAVKGEERQSTEV